MMDELLDSESKLMTFENIIEDDTKNEDDLKNKNEYSDSHHQPKR